jgi:hypothetical protein
MKRVVLTVALILVGVQSAVVHADPPHDREMLRMRLEHRLAETRQMQERLEAALERLHVGDPAVEVRADILLPPGGEARDGHRRGMRREGMRLGGQHERGPRFERLAPEEREELAQFVKEHAPELAQRLRQARERNPEAADRMFSGIAPRVRLLMEEGDAPMQDLRRRELRAGWDVLMATRDLTEALREDPDAPHAEVLANELRRALAEHFDVRLAMHLREIVILEERIEQLRSETERHFQTRDELIERRIDMLMRFAERRTRHAEPAGDDPER